MSTIPAIQRAVGTPFSSRLNPADQPGISRAKQFRAAARELCEQLQTPTHTNLFESEVETLLDLMRRAPNALNASVIDLQSTAGVGSTYFDDHLKHGRRPGLECTLALLTTFIRTADERLRDAEGDWVETPYTLDSARDLQKNLTQIVEFLAKSNSVAQIPELEETWRRHLIELCKMVIALLGETKVEVSMLQRCGAYLKQLACYLAPMVVQGAISGIIGATADQLMQPPIHCVVPNNTKAA